MAINIDLEVKKEYIKKQPVFTGLTSQETEELASMLVEKHFAPGDTIVREGDLVDSVYLIVSGTADVQHIRIKDNKPDVQSIATLGPEAAIGLNETGFYSISGLRTATVVAKTDMVALYLSVAAFHGFSLSHSHVNEVMRKAAASILGFKA